VGTHVPSNPRFSLHQLISLSSLIIMHHKIVIHKNYILSGDWIWDHNLLYNFLFINKIFQRGFALHLLYATPSIPIFKTVLPFWDS
jgi:hypothetical protein